MVKMRRSPMDVVYHRHRPALSWFVSVQHEVGPTDGLSKVFRCIALRTNNTGECGMRYEHSEVAGRLALDLAFVFGDPPQLQLRRAAVFKRPTARLLPLYSSYFGMAAVEESCCAFIRLTLGKVNCLFFLHCPPSFPASIVRVVRLHINFQVSYIQMLELHLVTTLLCTPQHRPRLRVLTGHLDCIPNRNDQG